MGNCCSTVGRASVQLDERLLDGQSPVLGGLNVDDADISATLAAITTASRAPDLKQQRRAAQALNDVIRPENQQYEREILVALFGLLQSSDEVTVKIALTGLGNFATTDAAKTAVVAQGGLIPLGRLLLLTNPEVLSLVCGCYTNLATVDANKVKIGASGAIPSLVRLCESQDRRVAHNAVGTLLNLSHAPRNRSKLVDAGALAVLERLLVASDMDERYYSAAALSNIAVDGEQRRRLLDSQHLIRNLLEALNTSSGAVQVQALLALLNLASDEDYQLAIASQGGIDVLVSVASHALQVPNVLVAVVAVLRNVSIHPQNESVLVGAGVVQLLLNVINTYSMPKSIVAARFDILAHSVSALRNIASSEVVQSTLSNGNDVNILVNLLHLQNAPAQLVAEVAAAISVLALSELMRNALAGTNVVADLVAFSVGPLTEVHGHCAAALGNLTASLRICAQFLPVWDDASAYLQRFLDSGSPTSIHIALWTLFQLGHEETVKHQMQQTPALLGSLRTIALHADSDIARLANKTRDLLLPPEVPSAPI